MANFIDPAPAATFDAAKMTKIDVARGEHLFLGLNCLEPGQGQAVHTHAGADKFYLVVSGKARIRVGDEVREVGAGVIAWCPADLPHAIDAALERTVVLVGMTPGPQR